MSFQAMDQPLAMKIVGYTPSGRPIIENIDGTLSTENTVTLEAEPGEWINVPLLIAGVPMTPDEALELVRREGYRDFDTGKPLRRFKSKPEALRSAQERSTAIDEALRRMKHHGGKYKLVMVEEEEE